MSLVIVGAGPIGLSLAICISKLNQALGLDLNVTLIDPRMGDSGHPETKGKGKYTRPGYLLPQIFEEVSDLVGDVIIPSPACHIKELERGLLAIARKNKNISIITQKYDRTLPEGIVVADEKGVKKILPIKFNAIFDCSGSKRVVIHDINRDAIENKEAPPFSIEPCALNPIENMLNVTARLEKKDFESLELLNSLDQTKLGTLDVTELHQAPFHWDEYASPFFRPMLVNADKNKVMLYCESPPGLPSEQVIPYIKTVLALMLGKSSITFIPVPVKSERYGLKPLRHHQFKVSPKKLSKTIHTKRDGSHCYAIGDSEIDPEFRLAHGIRDGIQRLKIFLEEYKLAGGDFTKFNFPRYQKKIDLILKIHNDHIKDFYEKRTRQLHDGLDLALTEYKTALKSTGLAAGKKEKIQYSYYLASMRSITVEAKRAYRAALKKDGKVAFKGTTPAGQMHLSQAFKLIMSLVDIPKSLVQQNLRLQQTILELAEGFKKIGVELYSFGNQPASENYHEKALFIYSLLSENVEHSKEKIKIYANLSLMKRQRHDYASCIRDAEAGIQLATETKLSDSDVTLMKLYNNKAYALIEIVKKQISSREPYDKIIENFTQIDKIINVMMRHPTFPTSELIAQFERCRELTAKQAIKNLASVI